MPDRADPPAHAAAPIPLLGWAIAGPAAALAAYLTARYPLAPTRVAALLLLYAAALWRWPRAWLVAVPAGLAGCGNDTVPKFKGTLGATYSEGPLSLTVQSRFQGSMTLNNTWTSGVQIDRNEIDPNAYLDLRASYKWNDIVQFYGAIDNVQDIPPLLTPPLASTGSSYQTLGFSGDNLGRVMRIGVRVSE